MNPQGPFSPSNFKNESRRANDGVLYIGQNKFDKKGKQINDFTLEFNSNNSIQKMSCPDRLRGQHCKIYYDTVSNDYKI